MQDVLSIDEAFGDLRDPRSRTPAHDLQEMLVVALCAILSGADSWVAIQLWAEAKLDWLRRYVPLASGVPSHDTFGRVFAALDAQQFEACFMRWVAPLCPALHDQVVAIDGKTLRRSHHDSAQAIHLVSAYGCGLGVMLGQQRTSDHSNEITAIPVLLDALLLKGAIVTIDAMGCQTAIAQKIVDAQADYVLAVKENSLRWLPWSGACSRHWSAGRSYTRARSTSIGKPARITVVSRRAAAWFRTSAARGRAR